MLIQSIFFKLPYLTAIILGCIGLFMSIANDNLLNKLFGLGLLQSGILLFFIALAKVSSGIPPVYNTKIPDAVFTNPLPHVLMLTAIVVGVAVLAVGLAMVYRIYKTYGTMSFYELEKKI